MISVTSLIWVQQSLDNWRFLWYLWSSICIQFFIYNIWFHVASIAFVYTSKVISRAGIFMKYHHAKYVHNYVTEISEICSIICGFIKIKVIFSFASNLYLWSFGTIIDTLMHSTQLESFPYFLGLLIAFYLIECVCRLSFLHHKMSLVRILTQELSRSNVFMGIYISIQYLTRHW
jgi:hypothetical protein